MERQGVSMASGGAWGDAHGHLAPEGVLGGGQACLEAKTCLGAAPKHLLAVQREGVVDGQQASPEGSWGGATIIVQNIGAPSASR